MILLVLCLIAPLVSPFTIRESPRAVPRVSVFYETLNTASRQFFVDQLKFVAENLNEFVEWNFVPFGTTTDVNNGQSYTCRFDEEQCTGNKIQACAIGMFFEHRPNVTIQFLHCMLKNRNSLMTIDAIGEDCANRLFVDEWTDIKTCIDSVDGKDFFQKMSEETAKVIGSNAPNEKFPIVFFNDQRNDNALKDFQQEICNTITENRPVLCDHPKPEKVRVALYYENFDDRTRRLMTRQIGPYFHLIEEYVQLDLVPWGGTQDLGSNGFNCSQGEEQCMANRIHAVVIRDVLTANPDGHVTDGVNRAVNFVSCMMGHSDWPHIYLAGEVCADKLGVDEWVQLLLAAETEDGANAYRLMKEKTDKTNETAFPMTTLDDVKNLMTVNDFVKGVCDAYGGDKRLEICAKVKVEVYYETLNHVTRQFILEEMSPVYNNFIGIMELDLIPGAMSTFTGDGDDIQFTCPYGGDECIADKIQACVMHTYWDNEEEWDTVSKEQTFQFIRCVFKNRESLDVFTAAERCANQILILDPWQDIETCANGPDGSKYLKALIEKSRNNGITDTSESPVVRVDGQEIPVDQHLQTAVCNHFDDDHKPQRCLESIAPKIKIAVYYESMNELTKRFVTRQFAPYYTLIEEMAEIDFVPYGNTEKVSAGGGQFQYKCSEGPNSGADQCRANRLQAVAINMFWNNPKAGNGTQVDPSIGLTNWLSCVFTHASPDVNFAGEDCAIRFLPNDVWTDIVVAANSDTFSGPIMTLMDTKTTQMKQDLGITGKILRLPIVTVDGHESRQMRNDLFQTVCDAFTGDKPVECTRVKVEVYYEAYNAHVRRFFLEQLRPTFEQIRESFDLELIPYGNTTRSEGDPPVYSCPNGEFQCLSNKFHACAVHYFLHDDSEAPDDGQIDGKNETILFLNCMMKQLGNAKVEDSVEICAAKTFIGDVFIKLWECARLGEGDAYLNEMRVKTLNIRDPYERSPWIVIDGRRSERAESDLMSVVCDQHSGERPAACDSPRATKVKMEFHYEALSPESRAYILSQLIPAYHSVEEITDLEIVPFGRSQIIQNEEGQVTDFSCFRGPAECRHNRIHTCIVALYWHNDDQSGNVRPDIDGKIQTLYFLKCFYESPNWMTSPDDVANACANEAFQPDPWTEISKCASDMTGDGIGYFRQMQQKVQDLRPPLTYTPWNVVNARHSVTSENHLRRTLCDNFKNADTKPMECFEAIVSEKPKVEFHYEPLNSKCRDFILQQLHPLHQHVEEIVDLELIPFGRTTMNEDGTFNCRMNDDVDCLATKIHACVVRAYYATDPLKVIGFLLCVSGPQNWQNTTDVSETCLNEVGIVDAWHGTLQCAAQGGDGDKFLKEYKDRIDKFERPLTHVPYVRVNELYDRIGEKNLMQDICDNYYTGEKPDQCSPELLHSLVNYEPNDAAVQYFFLEQINDFAFHFEQITDLEFVPYGLTQKSGTDFVCNNDPGCDALKHHACVIDGLYKNDADDDNRLGNGKELTLQLLICAFGMDSPDKSVESLEQCFNRIFVPPLDWTQIHACVQTIGVGLIEQNRLLTEALSPPLTRVPYVQIDRRQSLPAESDFVRSICDTYLEVKPPACNLMPKPIGPVSVGLYYSAFSAESRDFVISQLKPHYVKPSSRAENASMMMDVRLVPWGKSTFVRPSTGGYEFTCDGGPNECFANRIHACAVSKHWDFDGDSSHAQVMQFVICTFEHEKWNTEPATAGNECANQAWVLDPWPEIDECARLNTPEALDVYFDQNVLTRELVPPLQNVPHITINDVYNPEAQHYLLSSVCSAYKGKAPPECENAETPTPSTVSPPVQSTTPPFITPSGSTPPVSTTLPITTPIGSTPSPTPGSSTAIPITTPTNPLSTAEPTTGQTSSSGSTPPPTSLTPPPSGSTPPPSGSTPPPSGSTPPPTSLTPPPSGSTPPPTTGPTLSTNPSSPTGTSPPETTVDPGKGKASHFEAFALLICLMLFIQFV